MAKLLLIDWANLLMRHWHGQRCGLMPTPAQAAAVLTRSVSANVRALLEEEEPTHVVACRESADLWRYDYHPEWKGGRDRHDKRDGAGVADVEAMIAPWVERAHLCTAAGERQEGDDVVATLARRAERKGTDVVIYSRDSDLAQLVSERVTLRWPEGPGKPDVLYTPEKFRELYGVEPHQFPDLKTLLAYPKDNLRGVLGLPPGTRCAFGQKRAIELLGRYDSVTDLYELAIEDEALTEREVAWMKEHADGLTVMLLLSRLNASAAVVLQGHPDANLVRP